MKESDQPDIFVSYSREDFHVANVIVEEMLSIGYKVWWDKHIEIGKDYRLVIAEKLELSKCIVVIWTSNSLTSRFVIDEAEFAAESNKLVSLVLGNQRLPLGLRGFQSIQCDKKDEISRKYLIELTHHIKTLIGDPVAKKPQPEKLIDDSKSWSYLENETVKYTDLKNIFLKFKDLTDFYIAPDIPIEKDKNSRIECKINKKEQIIALFDNTVLGSATDCIAFTTNKMYWHEANDISKLDGYFSISYQEFPATRIMLKRDFLWFKQVSFNDKVISMPAFGSSIPKLVELLNDIKFMYKNHH